MGLGKEYKAGAISRENCIHQKFGLSSDLSSHISLSFRAADVQSVNCKIQAKADLTELQDLWVEGEEG